ncbi:MAG: hypothetical protein JNK94_03520 [Hyphomonadaceae bacterium]|nr:hypothetical protein [Hyphomonadaceae bacterium]MBX3510131.1 hypothetical protein [Hyphomonadaceae bacterium]
MTRLVLAALALTLVSACGVSGGLARPDPLWNRDETIARECARQRQAREELDPRCSEQQTPR